LQPVALTPDDVAFLQYTGGTTGVAKGAVLTHRNLVANVLQAEEWLTPALKSGKPIDQLVFVCALPLYHIFALTVCNLLGTREGALNLLIPTRATSPVSSRSWPSTRSIPSRPSIRFTTRCSTIRFRQAGFLRLSLLRGWRHGGAAKRGRQVEEADRLPHHRRLRPVGNLADRQRQPLHHRRIHRHHRPAAALDRDRHPR
jgi:hypothetical protein